jgi:hypothetical protein
VYVLIIKLHIINQGYFADGKIDLIRYRHLQCHGALLGQNTTASKGKDQMMQETQTSTDLKS